MHPLAAAIVRSSVRAKLTTIQHGIMYRLDMSLNGSYEFHLSVGNT